MAAPKRRKGKSGAVTRRSSAPSQSHRPPQRTSVDTGQIEAIVKREVAVEIQQSWSGPMPHPQDLAAYDQIVPGSAQKIVDSFVEQGQHRRELEKSVIKGSERRATIGQFLVYSLLVLGVVGGLVVAFRTNGYAGAAIITAVLGGGVALYVLGGRTPHDD